MKQTLALTLAALLLFTACGGGGGPGGQPDPDPDPQPSGPSDPAVIQQVLEDCALGQLDEIQAALDLFMQFLDPTATPPALTPAGSNLPGGIIGWSIDLEPAGSTDFTGTFQMLTAGGTPIDLLPIVLSVGADPGDIIAALPDDAQVVAVFDGALPPDGADLSGTVGTQLASGLPDAVTGDITAMDPGCSLNASFEDVAVSNLTGEIPSATYDLVIETVAETLTGQVTFDGTPTAVIELAQAGRDPLTYHYNLLTEVLTLQP